MGLIGTEKDDHDYDHTIFQIVTLSLVYNSESYGKMRHTVEQ